MRVFLPSRAKWASKLAQVVDEGRGRYRAAAAIGALEKVFEDAHGIEHVGGLEGLLLGVWHAVAAQQRRRALRKKRRRERRRMKKRLHDAVHVACVAAVVKSRGMRAGQAGYDAVRIQHTRRRRLLLLLRLRLLLVVLGVHHLKMRGTRRVQTHARFELVTRAPHEPNRVIKERAKKSRWLDGFVHSLLRLSPRHLARSRRARHDVGHDPAAWRYDSFFRFFFSASLRMT